MRALITLTLALGLSSTWCDGSPELYPVGAICGEHEDCAGGVCGGGTCLDPELDTDGDGLINKIEAALGTDPVNPDTDGDGKPDAVEVGLDLTNPIDTDGDGKIDAIESFYADRDGDCIPDERDPFDDVPESDLAIVAELACCCAGPCTEVSAVPITATCLPPGPGLEVWDRLRCEAGDGGEAPELYPCGLLCGGGCGHGGRCVGPNVCDCQGTGHGGPNCKVPVCEPACANGGACVAPDTCDCQGTGHKGTHCETPVCEPACGNGGACVAPDTCDCQGTGHGGAHCEAPVCEPVCANGGSCVAPNTCDCQGTGYAGPGCEAAVCDPACHHGGACVAPNTCECAGTNHAGPTCAEPVCDPGCDNGGACVAPDTCECDGTGYAGPTCADPVCDPGCDNGGACVAPQTCNCAGTGYAGTTCEDPLCDPGCANGGACVAPQTCDCTGTGYAGTTCEEPVCDPDCANGGACVAPQTCDCAGTGYAGTTCEEPACEPGCANGGACVAPQTCDCTGTGHGGATCDEPPCGVLGSPCPAGFACVNEGRCEGIATDEVWIPAGVFVMGCNAALDGDCQEAEGPQREVSLSAYAIDRTTVTVTAFKACEAAGGCAEHEIVPTGSWSTYDDPLKQDHPINQVRWADAAEYCAWAGKPEGVQRLCTEAEWERAARGGCETVSAPCEATMRTYPWGEAPPTCDHANLSPCSGAGSGSTWAVASTPLGVSPYGAWDMAGNVWEWIADWYAAVYPPGPATDPTGPATGSQRVLRGGAFNGTTGARSASRLGLTPVSRSGTFGIRCCRSLP